MLLFDEAKTWTNEFQLEKADARMGVSSYEIWDLCGRYGVGGGWMLAGRGIFYCSAAGSPR